MTDRIIVLVDMDCFYVQVEQRLQPQYYGKPCVVVQYNTWKGGGIIAVNYEARSFGITRGMRGDLARQKCPDLHLFQVPEVRGKADLTRYRDAGAEVIEVLSSFCDCVERASIDEAYLDITQLVVSKLETEILAEQLPQTSIVGWDDELNNSVITWLESINECETISDKNLAIAAVIVNEMRDAIFSKTKFKCSAGISHNKMLAKLACGLHKPNHQTILPQASVSQLFKKIPIHKLRNLGGKLGDDIKEKFQIETMFELSLLSEKKLKMQFGDKTGSWLYNVAKGIENEPVTSRQLPKSIGCGKNFPGKTALNTKIKVQNWLQKLAEELEERLMKDQKNNKRFAKVMTVSVRFQNDDKYTSTARTYHIKSYNASTIASDLYNLLEKMNKTSSTSHLWIPPIINLSLSAGKFQDNLDAEIQKIHKYFNINDRSPIKKNNNNECNEIPPKKSKPLNDSLRENSSINKSLPHASNSISNYFCSNNKNGECSSMQNSINVTALNNNLPIGGFFATKLKQNENKDIVNNNSLKQANYEENKSENSNQENQKELKLKNLEIPNNSTNDYPNFQYHEEINLQLKHVTSLDENLSSSKDMPLTEDLCKKCEQCCELIPIWKFQEHEDYHYALSVQQELKAIKDSCTELAEKTQIPQKRKISLNKKKTTKKHKDTLKTIDSFFKKC